MELDVQTTNVADGWAVRLRVSLDRAETNELFLAGDKLVAWPTEGMRSSGGAVPLERSSMFLSEIVAKPEGLELAYETQELAERTQKILAYQVRAAFPAD